MENTEYDLYNDIEYFENMLPLLNSNELIQDLHIHTCNSDGTYSLKSVCEKIHDSSIQLFCITDHNYLLDETKKCLMETNKLFVYGTELSCCYEGHRVHLLGYFLNTDNINTKCIINKIYQGHCGREKLRIKNMQNKSNIKLTYEKFISDHPNQVPNWKRVAESLILSGDAKDLNDASERFLKKGRSGYLSYKDNWSKVDVREAVLAIVQDGGLPVIAHLGDLEHSFGTEKTLDMLSKFKEYGIVGYDISNGGKHRKIPEEIVKICEEKFQLLSFCGTDCHDANFVEQCKSPIIWFSVMLVNYAQKYLRKFEEYKVIDLIHASFTPDFDFEKIPSGYFRTLEQEHIVSFKDLIENLVKKSYYSNINIILCIIIIINCLSFIKSENKLKGLFLGKTDVLSISKYFKELIKEYEEAILVDRLDEHEIKELIRIWIPIFYRVNLYDEANDLLNKAFCTKKFKFFNDFYERFENHKSMHNGEIKRGKEFFHKILNDFDKKWFTVLVLDRDVKSIASCYQKFIKCYLLENNPKIPNMLDCTINYDSVNFYEIFEDLYAATIITNEKLSKDYVLDILNKNNIKDNTRYFSEISRRWYHQRIIILLHYSKMNFEILVKTEKEYWFAYYYYWKTKNYYIFDFVSCDLEGEINKCKFNKEKMLYLAIEDIKKYVKDDE